MYCRYFTSLDIYTEESLISLYMKITKKCLIKNQGKYGTLNEEFADQIFPFHFKVSV